MSLGPVLEARVSNIAAFLFFCRAEIALGGVLSYVFIPSEKFVRGTLGPGAFMKWSFFFPIRRWLPAH